MWRASVITLYPEMFPGPLGQSLAGRALGDSWALDTVPLRDFGHGRHRAVDDTPAGGGPGMVLRADVVARALDSLSPDGRPRLVLSPRGAPLDQRRVRSLSAGPGVVLLCGRFEGVDERVIASRHLEEVSIGDYVLTNGALAAAVFVDAIARLIPGVLGDSQSALEDSHSHGLLEFPHYTRPVEFRGARVPDVLLSGNHGAIAQWRRQQAEAKTRAVRPDLLP